jgi:hypothetical protein
MTIPPYTAIPTQQAPPPPRRRTAQGLSFLVHGLAKAGKSTFADSGPRPTLILDVEGTSYWTPSRKIYWEPMRETVPVYDGTWDSCIVICQDHTVINHVLALLSSGRHPFKSLSVDSVTEVQQRIIDSLTAGRQMDRDKWGALLRQVASMTRQFRDLIIHPTNPLWSVAFTAGTRFDDRTGKWRPLVQGQIGDYLPYYVDLLGHISALPDQSRFMLIGPHPQYETGERVGGRLNAYALPLGYPGKPGYTIETILMQVLNPNGR